MNRSQVIYNLLYIYNKILITNQVSRIYSYFSEQQREIQNERQRVT